MTLACVDMHVQYHYFLKTSGLSVIAPYTIDAEWFFSQDGKTFAWSRLQCSGCFFAFNFTYVHMYAVVFLYIRMCVFIVLYRTYYVRIGMVQM